MTAPDTATTATTAAAAPPVAGQAPGAIEIVVVPEAAGTRLDRALATATSDMSRSRLQALVREGAVTLDGVVVDDPGRKVKTGERYRVDVPVPKAAVPAGEAIALSIVFEDEHLVVVEKPAGLVVHPAAGHESGTLVNALIAHCGDSLSGIGGVRRPGIVHRLDKDTSGLLVVAKTDLAHRSLAAQFKSHGADGRLERRYLALVWGWPARQKATIDAPLGRSRTARTKIAVTSGPNGRRAVTHLEVVERFTGADGKPLASLVALTLETGRTHQIRVHMAHAGHPVMGDALYASGFLTSASRLEPQAREALERLDRQALHAASLTIEHPGTGQSLSFESQPPPDMWALLDALRASNRVSPGESPRRRRI